MTTPQTTAASLARQIANYIALRLTATQRQAVVALPGDGQAIYAPDDDTHRSWGSLERVGVIPGIESRLVLVTVDKKRRLSDIGRRVRAIVMGETP